MNLFPDDQPWSLYRLPDGKSELLDAHNDVIATIDANPLAERVIVNAPEMVDVLRDIVKDAELIQDLGCPGLISKAQLKAAEILRRIEGEEGR